jgi:outer membrane protein TolC
MNVTSRWTVIGVACVAFTGLPAEGSEITEAEFLSRLTDEHPSIVALGDELARARGARRTARTENPDLAFEREAPQDVPAQSTVTLSWRPPLDGRRGLTNEAAEAGVAAAERRFEWERLRLREELRELFARWSFAVDRRDLFADLTERTRQLAARSRARASTGAESGLSAQRLSLAAAEARSALAGAETELVRVGAQLRTIFPELAREIRPVRPSLPVASAEITADRPDVAARELDVQRADLDRRLSGRYLEFPALVGGWTVIEEDETDFEGPVFGFEWNVPLFDRRQGERTRSDRALEVARARLELSRRQAAAELDAARESYDHLRVVAHEVAETMSGTETVIEAATAEFQAGESALTDFLETLRSVTDSRLAVLELHQAALAAHRRLELSVGRPLTDGGSQ